jgi:cytochrome o ubiquinol oxidase subunit 1
MPLYILGLMGVTRRMRVFDDPSLQIFFVIAGVGVAVIFVGIIAFLVQIGVSVMNRAKLRDVTGDPWNGRTLEWSTSSPPPEYNFAFTPIVHDLDAWYDMKRLGQRQPMSGFRPIPMPKNTGAGVVLAALATVCGFALIWHIWWLVVVSFLSAIATAIIHTFDYDRARRVPAETVAETESRRAQALAAAE